jgi:hypothetical protein
VAGDAVSSVDGTKQRQLRRSRTIYTSFVNSVMSQTGKAISPTAASILIADAQDLISHCP